MARPLIATDVPGCRDVVKDGINGYLCRPRSSQSLFDAMWRFAELDCLERKSMGLESRKLAQTRFDERLVINAYTAAINRLT